MLALGFAGTLLSIALISVSLLLIGLVLLQKNRGAGLSGAFGGVGGHSAFGTKTGDFLTWVTVSLVVVFLLLNIAGGFIFEPEATISTLPAAPSPLGPQIDPESIEFETAPATGADAPPPQPASTNTGGATPPGGAATDSPAGQ